MNSNIFLLLLLILIVVIIILWYLPAKSEGYHWGRWRYRPWRYRPWRYRPWRYWRRPGWWYGGWPPNLYSYYDGDDNCDERQALLYKMCVADGKDRADCADKMLHGMRKQCGIDV